jgi:hypothetical protein
MVLFKIKAGVSDKGAEMSCFFAVPRFRVSGTIDLLIDPGSTLSLLISEKDASRLGIDYSKMDRSSKSLIGIGGSSEAYLLQDVVLIFHTDEGSYEQEVDEIVVEKVREKRGELKKALQSRPSLLGWRFLEKYGYKLHADFRDKDIYLEK